jgi:hypothetical protein
MTPLLPPLVALAHLTAAASELRHPNFFSIPVGVVAAFALGGLWYSPLLCAKAWQRRIGKTREELGSPVRPMLVTVAGLGAMAIVIFILAGLIDFDAASGALLGLGLGLGLIAPCLAINYAYGARGFILWLIDVGYQVLALVVIGAVIGAMRG